MPVSLAVEFTVPRVPPTMNVLIRKHWTFRRDMRQLWMEEIRAALWYGRPLAIKTLQAWAECGDKVRIEIHVAHSGEFDPDNLASVGKLPLDALKALGCIVDDSHKHIEFPTPTQERSSKRFTRFRIVRLTQDTSLAEREGK